MASTGRFSQNVPAPPPPPPPPTVPVSPIDERGAQRCPLVKRQTIKEVLANYYIDNRLHTCFYEAGVLIHAALAFHLPNIGWLNIFAPSVQPVHHVVHPAFGRPSAPVTDPANNTFFLPESRNGAPGIPGVDYPTFRYEERSAIRDETLAIIHATFHILF